MGTTILPVLIQDDHQHADLDGTVLDEFVAGLATSRDGSAPADAVAPTSGVAAPSATPAPELLAGSTGAAVPIEVAADPSVRVAVAYTFGPPFGTQLVQWEDLEGLGLTHRALRRRASESLDAMLGSARLHGTPPALMLSFHGVETSLLLADAFWENLTKDFAGELVVGAPARDVVIVTGSESEAGLAKVRRCVDRVFFAGGDNLLTRTLLVWRGGWEGFDPPAYEEPDPFDDLWSSPDVRAVAPTRPVTPTGPPAPRRPPAATATEQLMIDG